MSLKILWKKLCASLEDPALDPTTCPGDFHTEKANIALDHESLMTQNNPGQKSKFLGPLSKPVPSMQRDFSVIHEES